MRPDADALILLTLLTAVFVVSVFVMPFLGYGALGAIFGSTAAVLDIALILDLRKGGGSGDGRKGGGDGRGGGGSGVREPRRPKDKPPAARASR
jgi:uncharacterized membrane protein YgcG